MCEDVDVNDEVVVEDDVVKDVEDEQVEVCDVDVNEGIQLPEMLILMSDGDEDLWAKCP